MKIKKSTIEKLVREELARALFEAAKEDEKQVDVDSAEKDNKDGAGVKPSANTTQKKGAEVDGTEPEPTKPRDAKGAPPPEEEPEEEPEEVPTGDDPADDDLSKDVEEPEPEDDTEPGSGVADELTGKTVQSITMEPDSKMMPGAKEINIQWEESPHPLKILIGKSGMIKFHYKGSLHNEL